MGFLYEKKSLLCVFCMKKDPQKGLKWVFHMFWLKTIVDFFWDLRMFAFGMNWMVRYALDI